MEGLFHHLPSSSRVTPQDVLPYFRRLEDYKDGPPNEYRATGGPIPAAKLREPTIISRMQVEALQELGIPYNPDYNGENQLGTSFLQVPTYQ